MSRKLVSVALGMAVAALLAVAAIGLWNTEPAPVGRAHTLEQQLRCPVCRSVSIAESPSSTAAAMRRDVEQQVAAGHSNREIIGFFQQRYGNWVLLDPPASGNTLLLWLLPLAGAGAGAAILVVRIRRSHTRSADLTPEQRDHVAVAVARARTGISEEPEEDDL